MIIENKHQKCVLTKKKIKLMIFYFQYIPFLIQEIVGFFTLCVCLSTNILRDFNMFILINKPASNKYIQVKKKVSDKKSVDMKKNKLNEIKL